MDSKTHHYIGRLRSREGAAGEWRRTFLNAPYLREVLVRMGIIAETFETAITWDRFPAFHQELMATARDAVAEKMTSAQLREAQKMLDELSKGT